MAIHDEFFEELLILAGAIKSIREATEQDLPEESLLALESANATLSTRALEVLDEIVSDAVEARPAAISSGPSDTPVATASGTVDANTSSQPTPADLPLVPKSPETA